MKRKTTKKRTKAKRKAPRAPKIALELHIHQEGDGEPDMKPADWWASEPEWTFL